MNYANHYADYAVITQIHYANTITQFPKISLRRLRKYHFHYASLRNGQLADVNIMIIRLAYVVHSAVPGPASGGVVNEP